jgi:hypothetical protein
MNALLIATPATHAYSTDAPGYVLCCLNQEMYTPLCRRGPSQSLPFTGGGSTYAKDVLDRHHPPCNHLTEKLAQDYDPPVFTVRDRAMVEYDLLGLVNPLNCGCCLHVHLTRSQTVSSDVLFII